MANGRAGEAEDEGPKFVSAYDALSHSERYTGDRSETVRCRAGCVMWRGVELDVGSGFRVLNAKGVGCRGQWSGRNISTFRVSDLAGLGTFAKEPGVAGGCRGCRTRCVAVRLCECCMSSVYLLTIKFQTKC